MTRPTVDITVDAADAPMLAALAKRRDHQRALGHADDGLPNWHDELRIFEIGWWTPVQHSAASLKRLREAYTTADRILLGEIAEVLEAETDEARIYELLDVAAVCLRIASKMQRDLDARDST